MRKDYAEIVDEIIPDEFIDENEIDENENEIEIDENEIGENEIDEKEAIVKKVSSFPFADLVIKAVQSAGADVTMVYDEGSASVSFDAALNNKEYQVSIKAQ